MAREFLDGFDYCHNDPAGVRSKYKTFGVAIGDEMLTELVPGRSPGQAYHPFQSGFSAFLWTRMLSASQTRYARFHLKPVGISMPAGVILRMENQDPFLETDINDTKWPSNGALLTVVLQPDGHLGFWVPGGPGFGLGVASNLGIGVGSTSGAPLQLGHVTYIEIKAVFGPHGSLDVLFDDVSVMSQSNLSLSLASVYPDRVSMYLASVPGGSLVWDDLDYASGDAGPNGQAQGFDGPCRITAHFPETGTNFWNRHGAINDTGCVAENPSDADATYIEGNAVEDYFGLAPLPCYGLVLSAAVNATAKRKPGETRTTRISFPVRPQPGPAQSLGIVDVGDSYQVLQSNPTDYSLLHPPARWTDADLSNAAWGIGTPVGAPGIVRVTQVFIEKLTSLRNQPYNCGGGSYAF